MNSLLFFLHGSIARCPRDQVMRFAQARIWLQDRQLEASAAARLCDAPDGPAEIGYGGARGGGKTHWLLAQIGADDCQRYPGLSCLLLRKSGKSNYEGLDKLRRKVLAAVPHVYTNSEHVLSFPNGSHIRAKHYHHESEIDNLLGLEYDLIAIEEATTLTWRKYQNIRTCCRTSKPNWRPRIYSTTNPGGVGHAWYKKLFIDPYYARLRGTPTAPQSEISNPQSDSGPHASVFVPATLSDNQFIDPDYVRSLEWLSGWHKRAWLHGDWDIAAGQFFTTFRREVHVVSDFDESRAVEWFAAFDYGHTHYSVFLLGCKDGDGNTYIIDEHAERAWPVERHAAAIHRLLQRHMLSADKLRWIVAGTDCFSTQRDGFTIAQDYAKLGLKFRPANTDRINGWATMLRLFGDPDYGIKPRLFIHQRCARLIDCIPALQHDPLRPEDVLKIDVDSETGEGGDDTADAARYLVHYKPAVLRQVKLTGW